MKTWQQDPSDECTYRQAITGDTIATAVWTIAPAGPTLDGQVDAAANSKINVSGLTTGTVYTLTVHITTAGGQAYDRSATIICANQ